MKKYLIALLFAAVTLAAGEINIAVAANVSYAMEELKSAYAKLHPETAVRVTLGSSGKLTAQISNGAPYGLFMAANMKYPEALYAEGIAVTEPVVYAQGALAMLSTRGVDFSKGISLAAEPTVGKIAVANPETAPYGKAAVEAMTNGGVLDAAEAKFVFAESISQTVTYALSAADVGFIAMSSLYSPKMAEYKEGEQWIAVDPALYTPIKQGIVLLKQGEGNGEYRAFYDFMLSAEAKAILARYGYIVE